MGVGKLARLESVVKALEELISRGFKLPLSPNLYIGVQQDSKTELLLSMSKRTA